MLHTPIPQAVEHSSARLGLGYWSRDKELMRGAQLLLMADRKAGFTQHPLPVLGSIFTVRRKEAETALTADVRLFFLAFLAPGEIGLQRHPNPIVQHKEPIGCQHSPDLTEYWQWFIEDMQDRRHGHHVHRASGVWQGLCGDIVDSQRGAGTCRRQLPAVGDHGGRHIVSEERRLRIALPKIAQKKAGATTQIDEHRLWRERRRDLGGKRSPEICSESLRIV
jgi:hypothetical protein